MSEWWNKGSASIPGIKAICEGWSRSAHYRTGLHIHTTDVLETEASQVCLQRPTAITLGVVLEGTLEFELAGDSHRIQSEVGQSCELYLINTPRSQTLIRHLRPNRRLRKVHLTVDPDWLQQHKYDFPELVTELESWFLKGTYCQCWTGNSELFELAENILRAGNHSQAVQQVQQEFYAIELLNQALRLIGTDFRGNTDALERARCFIESELKCDVHAAPNLDIIARQAGLSVSTLQRKFKARFGCTVNLYLRNRKLEHARNALQQGNTSIGEAAFLAGYRHASNFVTAYRKAYGVTPGDTIAKP